MNITIIMVLHIPSLLFSSFILQCAALPHDVSWHQWIFADDGVCGEIQHSVETVHTDLNRYLCPTPPSKFAHVTRKLICVNHCSHAGITKNKIAVLHDILGVPYIVPCMKHHR